ncbi:hypothetical protein [Streptomyces sp. NBC_01497]|uniref:hypothetical protein n=1 Tax=Streptomyces sp. NBC_01497 TaxID=2903885 RepID=UPI002E30953C|nr:hypothetical protein [Streptomyces sp. NBC_01497]
MMRRVLGSGPSLSPTSPAGDSGERLLAVERALPAPDGVPVRQEPERPSPARPGRRMLGRGGGDPRA